MFSLALMISLPPGFSEEQVQALVSSERHARTGDGMPAAEKTVLTPPSCGGQPVCSPAGGTAAGR